MLRGYIGCFCRSILWSSRCLNPNVEFRNSKTRLHHRQTLIFYLKLPASSFAVRTRSDQHPCHVLKKVDTFYYGFHYAAVCAFEGICKLRDQCGRSSLYAMIPSCTAFHASWWLANVSSSPYSLFRIPFILSAIAFS